MGFYRDTVPDPSKMAIVLVSFVMMLSFLGLPCQAEIIQEPLVVASDGGELNLSCSHSSVSNENIVWYRQFPSQGPRIIALTFNKPEKSTDPPGVLYVSSDRKSSVFAFSKATRVDSAVYLCALSATVPHPGVRAGQEVFPFSEEKRLREQRGCCFPAERKGLKFSL
ncbi:UNVERIFIED_CONTAM: hypothetical protein K2H54_044928 [Gekko kuhli]